MVEVVWMLNDLVFKCLSKSQQSNHFKFDQNCCHLGFPCSTGLVLEWLGPYPHYNWLSNQGNTGQWNSDPRITLDYSCPCPKESKKNFSLNQTHGSILTALLHTECIQNVNVQ